MPLITVSEGTPILKPGSYPATLVKIGPKRLVTKYSVNGEEQDFLEWTWLVEGPDKDVEITSLTSIATGPKSRIAEYLVALVGEAKVGANFDEKDLVGKQVTVSTVVDGEGFTKIDKIVAPVQTRAVSAPAKPKKVKAPEPAPAAVDDDDDEDDEEEGDVTPDDEDDLPF